MKDISLGTMFSQDMALDGIKRFYTQEGANSLVPFVYVSKTGFNGLKAGSASLIGLMGWHTIGFTGIEDFGITIGTYNEQGELCTFKIFDRQPFSWFGLVHVVQFTGVTPASYSFVGWKVGQEAGTANYEPIVIPALQGMVVGKMAIAQIMAIRYEDEAFDIVWLSGSDLPLASAPPAREEGFFEIPFVGITNFKIIVSGTTSSSWIYMIIVDLLGNMERLLIENPIDGGNDLLAVNLGAGDVWRIYGATAGVISNNATTNCDILGVSCTGFIEDEDLQFKAGLDFPLFAGGDTGEFIARCFGSEQMDGTNVFLTIDMSGVSVVGNKAVITDSEFVVTELILAVGSNYSVPGTFDERGFTINIVAI